jgi:ferric-dicitrate binding protein FerR (iron transport regulator)
MSTNGSDTPRKNPPDIFRRFDPSEQDDMKKLWKAGADASPARPVVEPGEVNKAWKSVSSRIDSNAGEFKQQSDQAPAAFKKRWKLVAAAAVLLLIAGVGFLFTSITVEAPLGEMAVITLPDGSAVELNSGSEIQYNRLFGYTNRDIQMDGEAFYVVNKSPQPFTVGANGASIRVTGTKFNVRSWKSEAGTEVSVAEGSVRFSRDKAANHSVTVGAGQSSTLGKKLEQPTTPMKAAVDRITGWRSNSLLFNDKSLAIIFNELERRFDVQIRVEDSAIGRRTLTAYYSDPSGIESVLQDICRVKGLKFAPTSNGYRVYE